MKASVHLWGLCALLLASCWAANAQGEDEWGSLNTNDFGRLVRTNIQADYASDRDRGAIYIDERPQDDVYDGSGDEFINDDMEGYSGDDEYDDGSADIDMRRSPCLRLKKEMQEKGLLGVYIPQCTPSGDFERIQCRSSTGVCWCVDLSGREIEHTKARRPERPDCNNIVIDAPVKPPKGQKGYNTRPDNDPYVPFPETEDSEFDIDRADYSTSTEFDNRVNNMPESEVEIGTAAPHPNGIEMLPSKGDNHVHSSAVLSQPGILAGIIGGALVGLLCAVLLVMFIVYRMRKKDEGSYALDERKHSPSMHTYARAPTKEFYA